MIKVTFSRRHRKTPVSAFNTREYLDRAISHGIKISFSEEECRYGCVEVYAIWDESADFTFTQAGEMTSLELGMVCEGWKVIGREELKDCQIK
jgi:hypothetical protein